MRHILPSNSSSSWYFTFVESLEKIEMPGHKEIERPLSVFQLFCIQVLDNRKVIKPCGGVPKGYARKGIVRMLLSQGFTEYED
jgi:hypothetical protein